MYFAFASLFLRHAATPCKDITVERRNGINYLAHIHHVIQGGIPILNKLEHARVVPILVYLAEDVQRLPLSHC